MSWAGVEHTPRHDRCYIVRSITVNTNTVTITYAFFSIYPSIVGFRLKIGYTFFICVLIFRYEIFSKLQYLRKPSAWFTSGRTVLLHGIRITICTDINVDDLRYVIIRTVHPCSLASPNNNQWWNTLVVLYSIPCLQRVSSVEWYHT